MKLRLGGIQNIINKAAEKERASAYVLELHPSSVTYPDTTLEIFWSGTSAGRIRDQLYSQLDMTIPFTEEAYLKILKTMWAGGTTSMIIHGPDSKPYRLSGAYVCDIDHHVRFDGSDELAISIRYNSFMF